MEDLNLNVEALKHKLLVQLGEQGFSWKDGRLTFPGDHKDALRAVHRKACAHLIDKARRGLERHEQDLLTSLADGAEINPYAIDPVLLEVMPRSRNELLFRYARLHWSIPVSAGYGRRIRFLIWDRGHDKLMGILGLSDPVFSLKARDIWIGWDKEQRRARLANVMDAFVLGAVPPYAQMLGGKLVSLAVSSSEIRAAFDRRYARKKTLIRNRRVGPLALVTTTSALGRSSIYNRISFQGMKVFHSVGFTRRSGEFPFINGVYRDLRELVTQASQPSAKHERWGCGFRNRREVVLKALRILGLPRELVYHGVPREVFVVPLAHNTKGFLRGEDDSLDAIEWPFAELAAWWKKRWALPRCERDDRFRQFRRESWRLWGDNQ